MNGAQQTAGRAVGEQPAGSVGPRIQVAQGIAGGGAWPGGPELPRGGDLKTIMRSGPDSTCASPLCRLTAAGGNETKGARPRRPRAGNDETWEGGG